MLYSAATDFLFLTLLFISSALYSLGFNTPEEFENVRSDNSRQQNSSSFSMNFISISDYDSIRRWSLA